MPELNDIQYDENKGEWFPFHDVENPNTRSRAMYFFHNSLGEVTTNVDLEFAEDIQIGGSSSGGGGSSWTGPADDIQSWPIKDLETGEPIENYSDGNNCYFYRVRSVNVRFHIHHPPGWNPSEGDIENQTGVSTDDANIYRRYVDALEFIFDGSKTESVRLLMSDQENNGNESIREMEIPVPLTYTDGSGTQRICDGSYDQTQPGDNQSVGYFCRDDIVEDWLNNIGGAGDAAQAANGGAGVWTWNGAAQWPGGGNGSNTRDGGSGVLTFNTVALGGDDSGDGDSETLEGFFLVDTTDSLNYSIGDYLLLEGDTQSGFHDRVVFVSNVLTNSTGDPVYEIQMLDDLGFFDGEEGTFNVTKLTNAPKLQITYTVPNDTSDSTTIVDDVPNV